MRAGDVLRVKPNIVVVCVLHCQLVILAVIAPDKHREAVARLELERCGKRRLLLVLFARLAAHVALFGKLGANLI